MSAKETAEKLVLAIRKTLVNPASPTLFDMSLVEARDAIAAAIRAEAEACQAVIAEYGLRPKSTDAERQFAADCITAIRRRHGE